MRAIILSFIFLFSLSVYSQESRVENCMMPCKLLQGVSLREYSVYLPKDFDKNSDKKYNVLYLLHGGGCANTDWAQFGGLKEKADSLIASGEVDEMVIVCPEGNKNNMIWFNAPLWKYEDFFFNEFMPYIENKYRCKGSKESRSVAGFSMGGGASMVYAVHHPEMFNTAYGLSSYLYKIHLDFLNNDPSGEWRQNIIDANNPVKAIAAASDGNIRALRGVRWFIDCGDDDFTFGMNIELIHAMRNKGIQYQFRSRDGGHDWRYWNPSLNDIIKNAFEK
ncbi:alpha/beta hydrolase-fold protein [Phocaeicola paurosaccharolyticus]|uniref:alpha/beta hydrolase n=1 Tax=Phocaeicola paurosaccharolyticus TaxID=732242 RepID=UPI002FE01000